MCDKLAESVPIFDMKFTRPSTAAAASARKRPAINNSFSYITAVTALTAVFIASGAWSN